MAEFIMLTRLSAAAVQSPKALEELEKKVMDRIRSECPELEWVPNYAILGPYDYLDVFRAPDSADAFKVATIIRSFGQARTRDLGRQAVGRIQGADPRPARGTLRRVEAYKEARKQ